MTQAKTYLVIVIILMCFSLCLVGQSRKVNFKYDIGGSSYKGSVNLLGVNETATSNANNQQNLKPGGKWNLSCPSNAEYCGLMLGFSNLKLDNPNHHAKIYFSDYSKLIGLNIDRRKGDFEVLSTGNNQAILVFGMTEVNQNGQIPFRIKISADGELVDAKSSNTGKEVIFLQNYAITENAVASGVNSGTRNSASQSNSVAEAPKPATKPVNTGDLSSKPKEVVSNVEPIDKPILSEEETWQKALGEDKIVNYTEYIRSFPLGKHVIKAREKVDSLKWSMASTYGNKDFDSEKKIDKYKDYLRESQNPKFKRKACKEIDILQWKAAKESKNYAKYLEDLIVLKESCPDYVPQNINAEEIALKTTKTCEGSNCSIKFENHIEPLTQTQFDFDKGEVEIVKIEDSEVFFKITNPKSKYVINYQGPLKRVQTFLLGLEDYFSLNFEVDKANKLVALSKIEGGVPPYFLQVKANQFFKQVTLGNGPDAKANLNELEGLPNEVIQLYLTDAEKKIEKYIVDVNFGSSFLQSQLFFLLLSVLAFVVIGILFYIKRKENQRKAAEWEMKGYN